MKKTMHTLAFFFLFSCTSLIAPTEKKSFDDVILNWLNVFGETIQRAKAKHYRIDNPEQAMIESIKEFLRKLDPHSSFLDPKTYKTILETTSGEFFGIGIIIDATRKPKDRFLMVLDIIPDGPSEKAGLLPYDKIIEIDGKLLEGMTTEEATSKLRGEKDTVVHIKVMREKKTEPIPFDITRGIVKEQTSLAFYLKDHDIYYLSLTSFTRNAEKQIEKLLKKSTKENYRALILDLRNNSGGLLSSAVNIAGLFLPQKSLVVTTRNKDNKETERYETKRKPIALNGLPIFILTNNFTASAAEILAGCLKMHSEKLAGQKLMVFLVGSTSFGKGSVQEIIPIGNDCAVKITTSLYHLPNGTTIQGTGIQPDFLVEKQFPAPEQIEWFQKFYGREQALKDYIKPHGSKPEDESAKKEKKKEDDKKPKNWSERARKSLAKDNQFLAAITLANLFDTTKKNTPALVNNRKKAEEHLKKIFATHGELNMEEIKA